MEKATRLGTDSLGRAIYACADCGTQDGAPYTQHLDGKHRCSPCARKHDRNRPRIDVGPTSVRLWGLTRREYILAAIDALDQAGVTPRSFEEAHRHAHGLSQGLLAELDCEADS